MTQAYPALSQGYWVFNEFMNALISGGMDVTLVHLNAERVYGDGD